METAVECRGIAAIFTAIAFVAVMFAVGCIDGDLQPRDGGGGPKDGESFDLQGRLVETDGAVRVADGSRTCGFFPDTCPAGSNCYSLIIDDRPQRRCLVYGLGEEEDDCSGGRPGECGEGLRCYGGTCRPICKPEGRPKFGCSAGSTCLRVEADDEALAWGVCVEQTDACTLWPNDDCPSGENCYPLQRGHRCLAYSPDATVGDRCDRSSECGADQVCVKKPSGAREATCRPKCDASHPCETGSCEMVSDLEFGACLPRRDAG